MFFPSKCSDHSPTPISSPGETRRYDALNIFITFTDPGRLRIPTRESSEVGIVFNLRIGNMNVEMNMDQILIVYEISDGWYATSDPIQPLITMFLCSLVKMAIQLWSMLIFLMSNYPLIFLKIHGGVLLTVRFGFTIDNRSNAICLRHWSGMGAANGSLKLF